MKMIEFQHSKHIFNTFLKIQFFLFTSGSGQIFQYFIPQYRYEEETSKNYRECSLLDSSPKSACTRNRYLHGGTGHGSERLHPA